MRFKMVFVALFTFLLFTKAEVSDTDLNDLSEQQNAVQINKCCEENEIAVDSVCRLADQYNESTYINFLSIQILLGAFDTIF